MQLRFTDRVRKVMEFANQEAIRLGHEYIGTEHIILGLLKLSEGAALTILHNVGADLGKIRFEIQCATEPGPDQLTFGKLGFAESSRIAVEYAKREALRFEHENISTGH